MTSDEILSGWHSEVSKQRARIGRQHYIDAHHKTLNCEKCHKPFTVQLCSIRRFCSRHCKDRWWAKHWFESATCPGCGKAFQRSAKRKRLKVFCSRSCYLQYLTTLRGPRNRNWKGGSSYYGPDWDNIAANIRERDRICQDCGKTPQANGGSLDVHHIVDIRQFNGDLEKANAHSNLKALCKVCHRTYQERDY